MSPLKVLVTLPASLLGVSHSLTFFLCSYALTSSSDWLLVLILSLRVPLRAKQVAHLWGHRFSLTACPHCRSLALTVSVHRSKLDTTRHLTNAGLCYSSISSCHVLILPGNFFHEILVLRLLLFLLFAESTVTLLDFFIVLVFLKNFLRRSAALHLARC